MWQIQVYGKGSTKNHCPPLRGLLQTPDGFGRRYPRKRCGLRHSTPPELVTEDSPWGAHVPCFCLECGRESLCQKITHGILGVWLPKHLYPTYFQWSSDPSGAQVRSPGVKERLSPSTFPVRRVISARQPIVWWVCRVG